MQRLGRIARSNFLRKSGDCQQRGRNQSDRTVFPGRLANRSLSNFHGGFPLVNWLALEESILARIEQCVVRDVRHGIMQWIPHSPRKLSLEPAHH